MNEKKSLIIKKLNIVHETDENKMKINENSDRIQKEINDEIEKEKQLELQKEKEKAELHSIIKLLKIKKEKRTKDDIIKIKDYLCNHVNFFKKLLEQSEEKLLKLIPSLNYECFKQNERIMNFGEEGDKCYILLKGSVGIYKPFPITKQMTLRDYVEYLVQVRDIEKNIPKFERILSYNSKIDKYKLYEIDFDYTKIPKTNYTLNIMAEEERELGKGKPGSSFGEMALIKNEPRNASIIVLERCYMISIEKNDYTKIVKDIEEQRINKELATFKQNYPIFRFWPPSKCFKLLSGFITEEFDRDDYVFKQNDIPNAIYLIKDGTFEVSSSFNFNYYEQFINYIHDSSTSLMNDMDNPFLWKEDKINKKINDTYDNISPLVINRNPIDKFVISLKKEKLDNDLLELARNIEGEIAHNKNHIFKANIQKLESPNIFGLLEMLELKHRFYSVKCISKKGTLLKFPVLEFLQLIPTDKRNQFYLQQKLFEEKKFLIAQLKNTVLAKLNFVKKEENKNFYIDKHYFNNSSTNKYSNKIDFKKQHLDLNLSPLKIKKKFNDIIQFPKLSKCKSFLHLNLPKQEKKENIISSNDYTNKDEYSTSSKKTTNIDNNNNSVDNRKYNPRNGIVLGFKNSVIKLNREKMAVIKELFPQETEKKVFPHCLDIKKINNSDKEYIRYLENNVELSKTPNRLGNICIRGPNCMTGKKYVSFETSRIVNKLNNNSTTIESKRNSELFLPYINKSGNSSSIINDGSTVQRIKFFNYKVEE